MTVGELLIFYSTLKGVSHEYIGEMVKEVMDACNILNEADKRCNQLSGGNQRKLSLSCAFIGPSKLILIDEPTIGLDPISKKKIWKIIK